MTTSRLLDLVDAGEFRQLFIDQLGWNNPDKPDLRLTVADDLRLKRSPATADCESGGATNPG